jgi:16S rRNA processing protein RimM
VSPGDPAKGRSKGGRGSEGGAPDDDAAPSLVYVGKVVRARGVAGELEVEPSGRTVEGLNEGAGLFLEKRGASGPEPHRLASLRRLGARLGLKLRGVDTPESARTFAGASMFIESEALPELPEGQYYHYEIVGMTVVDADGAALGEVAEVMETGGADVYVVRDGERELLLPATDQVVVKVDLDAGRMTVKVPPGLVEIE